MLEHNQRMLTELRERLAGAVPPAPFSPQDVDGASALWAGVIMVALSYDALLEAFWRSVPDPTSAYRQGADVGPQYESVIFYHSEAQREATADEINGGESRVTHRTRARGGERDARVPLPRHHAAGLL